MKFAGFAWNEPRPEPQDPDSKLSLHLIRPVLLEPKFQKSPHFCRAQEGSKGITFTIPGKKSGSRPKTFKYLCNAQAHLHLPDKPEGLKYLDPFQLYL